MEWLRRAIVAAVIKYRLSVFGTWVIMEDWYANSRHSFTRRAVARVHASDKYWLASGKHHVARGDRINVAHGDASYWAHADIQ